MQDRQFGFSTRAIHAGTPPDPVTGARVAPIYQSAAFVFDSTEEASELFQLRSYGHIYSRISNPTVAAFEERMASLEGGLGAIAFSSGLAAQLCTVLALAQSGDHVVSSQNVYGGTVTQFTVTLKRLGIETTFLPVDDDDALRGAVTPKTKMLFAETIGNPAGNVADLRRLAQIAHDAGIPLVVDNTFATPYLCRPIEYGADLVLHSATKFINGHGTTIGGVLVESGKFPWDNGRFPLLSEASPGYHNKVFTETFGEYAFLMRARAEVLRDVGAQMAPMDAWLLLLGLETLPIRMEAHVRNARTVAEFLQSRDEVDWVSHPGFPSHPQHDLSQINLP
ncbi:MAG: O-acetylhomoserine aminocarboxypropyltransferase/cysteine synthase, partial [Candidatus Eremiobacteraeota bacterium]|nr:O-acetylhomoserine aminocarboxypropyltransferase/cysteine synthase [Candidatus Eremiobacteraeota bacterium]